MRKILRSQMNYFKIFSVFKLRHKTEKSCRWDNSDTDDQKVSISKHLGSEKHWKNMKHKAMIKPEWLFQEPIENIPRNKYSPKALNQIVRENFKIDVMKLSKELAKRMINPYYFTDGALQVGLNNTLESHLSSYANSIISIKTNFTELETRHVEKILHEVAYFY